MFTTRLRHPALFVLSVCLCLLAAACGSTSDLTGTSGQVAATSTTSQHPTPGHTPGVVTAGQHATLY
nr:hypothetical protein [Ktedonobacteraceae bacterium]